MAYPNIEATWKKAVISRGADERHPGHAPGRYGRWKLLFAWLDAIDAADTETCGPQPDALP